MIEAAPTPHNGHNREGHIMYHDVALILFGKDSKAQTSLSDLPPFKDNKSDNRKVEANKERERIYLLLPVSRAGTREKFVLS